MGYNENITNHNTNKMPRTHEHPTSHEQPAELTSEEYQLARTALDAIFADYQIPADDQRAAIEQFESNPSVQREILEIADPSLAHDDSEDFKLPELSE